MKQPKVNYKKFEPEYTEGLRDIRRKYVILKANQNRKVNYLYESKESIAGFEDELTANEINAGKFELIWRR
jgi:uncharacterized protein (DUF488 family)